MSEQPNALRLAKWLDAMPSSGYALPNQAATELRRLHEEVNEQSRLLGMSAERELALLAKIDLLERQLGESVWNYGEKVRANQELLEALKLALGALEYIHKGANNQGPHTGISWRCVSNKAEPSITAIRAAIAKGETQ